MIDNNSNKRPPDDPSVGSASKKMTTENLESPVKVHRNTTKEGNQENFKSDIDEEKWSVKSIPGTTEAGERVLIKIGNKTEPITKDEWEEIEQMCKTRSHHLDTSLKDPESLDK